MVQLTSLGMRSEDVTEVSDAATLRRRASLPKIRINGVWLAPQAVQHALSSAN
jgi:hypothetical protein